MSVMTGVGEWAECAGAAAVVAAAASARCAAASQDCLSAGIVPKTLKISAVSLCRAAIELSPCSKLSTRSASERVTSTFLVVVLCAVARRTEMSRC